jgi:hypothetical protein
MSNLVLRRKGFRVYKATALMLKKNYTLNGVTTDDYLVYGRDQYATFDGPEWVAGSLEEAIDFIDSYDEH